MATYRVSEAASLLGVSHDTVRRWAITGRLRTEFDDGGRRVIDGNELARFARSRPASTPKRLPTTATSADNRFAGLVISVVRDVVMARVELQCGPYRMVSLMTCEAADHLGLHAGVLAVAAVESTDVVVKVE